MAVAIQQHHDRIAAYLKQKLGADVSLADVVALRTVAEPQRAAAQRPGSHPTVRPRSGCVIVVDFALSIARGDTDADAAGAVSTWSATSAVLGA